MKINFQLIPLRCVGKNVHSTVPQAEWDRLRRVVYAQAGYECSICGSGGRPECHEVWDYIIQNGNRVQRLVDMVCLCHDCHMATHMGIRAFTVYDEVQEVLRLVQHIMKVNGWSLKKLRAEYAAAVVQYTERSRHLWQLDISLIDTQRFNVANKYILGGYAIGG